MILKHLSYLVALAKEEHFGRAAAAAHVSQPTLSAAIRSLEEELGIPIVERGHRFNGFTPEGLLVLEHATRMIAECEIMTQRLAEMNGSLTGRLRLGCVPTALPTISRLTAAFYARHPNVTSVVLSLTSNDIIKKINNFDLDIGITYIDNEPLAALRCKPVYDETYVFLTSIHGPFAQRETMTWREAADARLCLLTPDMQNRRIIDAAFLSVGKAPSPAVETNSIFNLCSHAASGHWSSIVPRHLLLFFGTPENTKALPLIEPELSRTIGVVLAEREPASPLAKSLFDFVQALALS